MESLISIIIPCRNEEKYIELCITSVLSFELPDQVSIEILVLDGGSTDRTREIVEGLVTRDERILCLENPGRIQSCAMNIGIRAATGELIMRLDAHTFYPANYLRLCYETILETGSENVGGLCITLPGAKTYEATLVQALTTHKFGVGNSGFRTGAQKGPRDTVPFGFFRKTVFDRIGFFDERLVRAQDYEFNRRIVASGGRVWLNPEIQSSYFNQKSLVAFYKKQLFLEAPYNAYMWYLAPYAFALRHAVTGAFASGVLLGLIASPFSTRVKWAVVVAMSVYGILAIVSAIQQAIRFRNLAHAFLLPFCFFSYHFIHGLGVLTGIAKLLLGVSPVQRSKEPWPGVGRLRAWPQTSTKSR